MRAFTKITASPGIQQGAHLSPTKYRGSYMSAHVLLNLLNEFGKRDKM